MKIIAILIVTLIFGIDCNCYSANSELAPEPCKILFIGSSYFNYNNLPELFQNLIDGSKEVLIDQYIVNGLFLSDHASSDVTEAKINEKEWDYVVLQGVGVTTAYPELHPEHPVYSSLVTLRNKIYNNYDSTKIIFCLPWAFEDGMTWLEGWTDTYEDMQVKILNKTLQYSDDIGFLIAPVGWAWYKVLEEKGFPLHYLHMSDWNHPTLSGSYLMACVIYSTIFQESTTDILYNAGLQNAEADIFQTEASNTVMNDLDKWNIPEIITGIEQPSVQSILYLQQNFPNPFNSSTLINYETRKAGFVEISLYDQLGNKYANLVNEYKLPGKYCLRFEGYSLPGGIYYYSVKTGSESITKKMLLIN